MGREALEAVLIVAGFVGFGLGWAELERAGATDPAPLESPYPARMAESDDAPTPRIWLVDGFNVLNTAVLSGRDRREWWSEARRAEVMELAGTLGRDATGAEVWVVFDGPRDDGSDCSGDGAVRKVFAPSADEWLVKRVKSSRDPSQVAVVTADRKVADRSRHRGAQVVSPRAFLERCRGGESSTS